MKSPDFFLKIPVELYRAVVVRVVLLLVFSGSLALIGWSFGRLAPAEKKLQMQTDKIARLEDEVLKLELKWNPREAEQVAARFKQAQEQVFAGNEEFLRWQDQLKSQSNQMVLEIKAQIGKTQACPLPNQVFSIISATVDAQPIFDEPSTNSPYKRVLDFAQYLTTQKKRVDLVDFMVNGNSNSVTQAKLGLQLWAQETIRVP